MNAANRKVKKAPKDRDLDAIFGFLRISGLTVPLLSVLGGYIGYTHFGLSGVFVGVLVAGGGGIVLSFAISYLLDSVGGATGILFGRKRAVWTTREQVQGLMSQTRFNHDNQNFEAAFEYINQVLEKDPHYPDALFLKAQILWDGFEDAESAKPFLEKIMTLAEADSTIRSRASTLYAELSAMESIPAKSKKIPGFQIGLAELRPTITERLSNFLFEELKEKIEETPVARWAIGITLLFAFLSLLLATLINLQIDTFEAKSRKTLNAIKQTQDEVAANDESIQKTDTAIKDILSRTKDINDSI
jgi:hypothetical protein